jgi:Glycosyl transferase family 2
MDASLIAALLAGWATLGALPWWVTALNWASHRRDTPRELADLPDEPPIGGWPSLALIFAARNEAVGVEAATRSMLALDYPGLHVTAVDDRSTDATGTILDAIARDDPRLTVVHVLELPAGWLGKTNALQLAANACSDEWILMTDGDVVFAPSSVQRAVAYAVKAAVDHVPLAPDTITESTSERIFLSMFLLAFAMNAPPWRVVERASKAAVGVGAFNLVRAEAFRAIGGLEKIALSVDDDMRLGQALKFAGYRAAPLIGRGQVSVRWHVGMGGMIRGLEKNFFSALDFKLWLVPFAVLTVWTIGVMPFVGLFVGPWPSRVACAVAILIALGGLASTRGLCGVRWYHGLFLPIGALAFIVALLRSTVVTLKNGGVRWRDHLYPLADLRAHCRRRNEWLREVWKSTR